MEARRFDALVKAASRRATRRRVLQCGSRERGLVSSAYEGAGREVPPARAARATVQRSMQELRPWKRALCLSL